MFFRMRISSKVGKENNPEGTGMVCMRDQNREASHVGG